MKAFGAAAFTVLLIAGASAQQAPQTIDLPSIDRTQIAFRLDAEPSVVIGPGKVPGYFGVANRVWRLTDGRIVMATAWGFSQLGLYRHSRGSVRPVVGAPLSSATGKDAGMVGVHG